MQKLSVHDAENGSWVVFESAPTCAHRLIIKTISFWSVFAVFADKFPGNDPVQSHSWKSSKQQRTEIGEKSSDGGGNTFSKSTNRLV